MQLSLRCPLLGVKRTSVIDPQMSAYDPKRTSGPDTRQRQNLSLKLGSLLGQATPLSVMRNDVFANWIRVIQRGGGLVTGSRTFRNLLRYRQASLLYGSRLHLISLGHIARQRVTDTGSHSRLPGDEKNE